MLHNEPLDMADDGTGSDGEYIASAGPPDAPIGDVPYDNEAAQAPFADNEQRPSAQDSDAMVYDVSDATLDIDSYAAQYKSYALIRRLLFIADHCASLRHDALFALINYVKENMCNVDVYKECIERLGGDIDQEYVDQTKKRAAIKMEKLDADLKHYRTNSISDSIRRGYVRRLLWYWNDMAISLQDDLGEHCIETGELSQALRAFSRARDYCTVVRNQVQMCLNVIRASAYTNNYTLVLSYVRRALGRI